jgi:hypothetical protein
MLLMTIVNSHPLSKVLSEKGIDYQIPSMTLQAIHYFTRFVTPFNHHRGIHIEPVTTYDLHHLSYVKSSIIRFPLTNSYKL